MSLELQNLVEQGAFVKGTTIFASLGSQKVEATINHDGTIQLFGATFSSPSVAAGVAITKTTGRTTAGRKYAAINGWRFWQYKISDSDIVSLDEIRRRYAS